MRVSTTARNFIFGVLSIFGLVGIWQIYASRIHLPLILPTPAATFNQIREFFVEPEFWKHLSASLIRGLTGFVISLVAGTIVGFLSGISPGMGAFFRPLIVLVRSAPSMSFIILALIWFKGDAVVIFVIFLVAFPIIAQNVMEGIRNVDPELIQMVKVFRVSKHRRLLALYLPSVWPYLAAGMAGGLGITWKALIAAEVLAYPQWGIGTQMDSARTYLETEKVFAWSILVICVGLGFEYLLGIITAKSLVGRKGHQDVQS